jgi:hypothetical protein
MATKSSKWLRTYSIVAVIVTALTAAACGSVEPSPTAPSPVPSPAPSPSPSPSPAPTPSGPGKLEVTINPNPVPWSGNPIDAAGCQGVSNTWSYTQVLKNTGGKAIVVSDRTDFFNNREVSKRNNLGISIAPGAESSVTTRWCSANVGPHTAKTDFSGQDSDGVFVVFHGTTVMLSAR